MSQPVVGFQQVAVDANSDKVQAQAHRLAEQLVKRLGVGEAISVSLLVVEEILKDVLHQETPLVENNIAAVRRLLAALQSNVLWHVRCARNINKAGKDEQVH